VAAFAIALSGIFTPATTFASFFIIIPHGLKKRHPRAGGDLQSPLA
jgi:hypothetical protein